MAKGVFRGFVTGLVVAGAGVSVFSLTQVPTPAMAPKAEAVEVPAGSDFQGEREDTAPTLPGAAETPPQPGEAPKITEADGAEAPVDEAATQPAARPETGAPQGTLSAPNADGSTAQTSTDAPAPVVAMDVDQPEMPAEAEDGKISTDPAQPTPPSTPETTAFPNDESMDATPKAEENAPPTPSKRADPLPSVTDPVVTDPAENRPRIGTPVGTFTDTDAPAAEEVAAPAPDPIRPIEANASTFDNPEAKPLMSIILLDDEAGTIGAEALTAFPYPISIAVNPLSPNVQARTDMYRAAGFEVMAQIDMPQGATASDTETLLRAALGQMPDAVAVMEGAETGLQTDKPVSDQAAAILAETGHGLVLFPKGLNTAQKLAAQDGVPSATVFRDFDAKGQNASIIRRFLDQAAFKARQEENGVIMLGRMRADTISALLLWGLQDRASSVALAPISALLLATEN
ncbi:MAG: divergent polysaccharide deacetylase family protein [Thalassovita sp.]